MTSVVTLDRMTRRYGDVVAAREVSFDVRRGEMFGLIGPDGAGKTTTLRVVLGLLQLNEGRVSTCGLDPWNETDALSRVDVIVVVSAPEEVQRQRVLARPGMNEEKLASLIKRQLPDVEKRARADFVVDTGTSLADMQDQIDKILDSLKGRQGRVMERLRHGQAT